MDNACKEHHHCVTLDVGGERRLSRRVRNDELGLLELTRHVPPAASCPAATPPRPPSPPHPRPGGRPPPPAPNRPRHRVPLLTLIQALVDARSLLLKTHSATAGPPTRQRLAGLRPRRATPEVAGVRRASEAAPRPGPARTDRHRLESGGGRRRDGR